MGKGQSLISWQRRYGDWDPDKGLGAPCFSCHLCDVLFMVTENIFTQIHSHHVVYI